MPAALKKPMKAKTPKKPTSKSKTGNSACSQAASNWQLSIRGKEALNPDTYTTLAKCRAMNRTAKQAGLHEASGKLSAQGKQALEGRLQKRFDSGLITQKSRDARLKELLAARSAKQSAQVKPALKRNSGITLADTEKMTLRERASLSVADRKALDREASRTSPAVFQQSITGKKQIRDNLREMRKETGLNKKQRDAKAAAELKAWDAGKQPTPPPAQPPAIAKQVKTEQQKLDQIERVRKKIEIKRNRLAENRAGNFMAFSVLGIRRRKVNRIEASVKNNEKYTPDRQAWRNMQATALKSERASGERKRQLEQKLIDQEDQYDLWTPFDRDSLKFRENAANKVKESKNEAQKKNILNRLKKQDQSDRIVRFAQTEKFLKFKGNINNFFDKEGNLRRTPLVNARKELAQKKIEFRQNKRDLEKQQAEKWIKPEKRTVLTPGQLAPGRGTPERMERAKELQGYRRETEALIKWQKENPLPTNLINGINPVGPSNPPGMGMRVPQSEPALPAYAYLPIQSTKTAKRKMRSR